MRTQLLSFVVLPFLLLASASVTAQSPADPSPECPPKGRGAEGAIGEIRCREDTFTKTTANDPRRAPMLYWLAQLYDRLGETKAEEYYERLVADYCKEGSAIRSLCDRAQARISELAYARGVPRAIKTEFTLDSYSHAISPDGKKVIYVGSTGGTTALWLHDLDTGKAAPIPGTEGRYYVHVWISDDGTVPNGANPFWSPDGKSIGYFEDGKLKRIDIDGKNAKALTAALENDGGSWGSKGTIVFVPRFGNAIYFISENGGEPTAVKGIVSGLNRSPQFLPDGIHFLLSPNNGKISVGSVEGENAKELGVNASTARFAPPDQLLFVNNGALFAQRLDLQKLELAGDAVRIVDRVASHSSAGISVSSQTGAIAYRTNASVTRQLLWFDRQGRATSYGGPQPTAGTPRFSPDGSTILLARFPGGRFKEWVAWRSEVESGTGNPTSLPSLVAYSSEMVWSPDGKSFAFGRAPGPAGIALYRETVARGSSSAEQLYTAGGHKAPLDWNGDNLLFARESETTGKDILVLPLQGGDPIPVASGAEDGRFYPDGRWIAYQGRAQAGGLDEVYIQRFPGTAGDRRKVSPDGGRSPQWSRDGRELFFLALDNRLMAATVTLPADGGDIQINAAKPVFPTPLAPGSTYSPAPDGKRFLVHVPEAPPPIYVRSKWTGSTATTPASVAAGDPDVATAPRGGRGTATAPQVRQVVVVDRKGAPLMRVGDPISGGVGTVTISPDGRRVAIRVGAVLSVIDIATNRTYRVTSNAPQAPMWSPDGNRIAYFSNRNDAPGVYVRLWNGEGTDDLLSSVSPTASWNWSLNDRFIGVTFQSNFAALTTSGERKVVPIVPASGKTGMRLSPDGGFVAYIATESGTSQVFVRSFDPDNPSLFSQGKITTSGAVGMIRWHRSGKELYYLAPDGNVMAVSIGTAPQIRAGEPAILFHVPTGFSVSGTPGALADVSADGERFVFLVPVDPGAQQ